MKKYPNFQMYRVDGRNLFLEVMSSMIDKGKVILNFIQYDANKPVGERQGRKISIYMDLEEAKNFFHQAAIGGFNGASKLSRMKQKEGGYKYAQPIFSSLGGTTAETLKKRGEERKDGKPEARVFDLTPGDRQPWVLQAKIGGGKLQPNGLISMDGKPDFYLMVGLSDFDFRKMGTIVYDKIKLIEMKLAFGGDCDLDSIVSLGSNKETEDRILQGLISVYQQNTDILKQLNQSNAEEIKAI